MEEQNLNNKVTIETFKESYGHTFKTLNLEWIEEFFVVEQEDLKILSNPKSYVIDKGGEIFFAIKDDKVIATSAMVYVDDSTFELAKMTVAKEFRGLGIANQLMDRCIDFAKGKNAKYIVLITNSALVIARNLYDKYQFKEIDLDSDKYGDRGNVKMTLNLAEE